MFIFLVETLVLYFRPVLLGQNKQSPRVGSLWCSRSPLPGLPPPFYLLAYNVKCTDLRYPAVWFVHVSACVPTIQIKVKDIYSSTPEAHWCPFPDRTPSEFWNHSVVFLILNFVCIGSSWVFFKSDFIPPFPSETSLLESLDICKNTFRMMSMSKDCRWKSLGHTFAWDTQVPTPAGSPVGLASAPPLVLLNASTLSFLPVHQAMLLCLSPQLDLPSSLASQLPHPPGRLAQLRYFAPS